MKFNHNILFEILSYLSTRDIIKCSLVCKLFYNASRNDLLWKHKLTIEKGNDATNYMNVFKKITYTDTYKMYYCIKNLQKFRPLFVTEFYEQVKLNLTYCYFKKIPYGVTLLHNLEILYLNDNRLLNFDEITNLTNLQGLYIDYNKLTSIPNNINNLINLRILRLHNNNITHIPYELCKLTNLEFIDLSSNLITKIPYEFYNLEKLKSINFSYNRLKYFPFDLPFYIKLEEINIKCNNIDLRKLMEMYNLYPNLKFIF